MPVCRILPVWRSLFSFGFVFCQVSDEIPNGFQVVILEGFFAGGGLGGDFLGDQALGLLHIATQAFVAGEVVTEIAAITVEITTQKICCLLYTSDAADE